MLVYDASWKGAITETPLGKGLLQQVFNKALSTRVSGSGTLVAVFELELVDLGADLGDVVLADLTRYETSSTF